MFFRKYCMAGAAALFLLGSGAAFATTHALIMTISQYQGGIPPLKGVMHDGENARNIARKMGIKDEDIHFLKDDQLVLSGIRAAFDDLESRLSPGDQVFIYYSGHGGRSYVKDPVERCAESLIADDTQGFVDAELETRLKKLSEKAQKVIVFLDACHSGGVTTRAINAPFAPKYWSKGEADACSKPVNVLTRSLGIAAKSPGSGAQNYVYIAAAKDNEISLDQPGKGGVATQAWLKCMSGGARDSDGSGGLSVEEIRVCAQARIDETLKDAKGFTPHHISITGNSGMVMKLVDAASPPKPNEAVKPGPDIKPVETSPNAAMRDIYNGRDDKRSVTLASTKSALKIGSDPLDFTLASTHAGYVYILMAGSDGKAFDMLFPNKIDGANFIQAGETVRLPRQSWQLVAQGPAGKDHLLVIVADSPRDFSSIGMVPSGPFSSVAASQAAAKDIQLVTRISANAAIPECTDTKKRNLAVMEKKCSNAYGAALLSIEEVK